MTILQSLDRYYDRMAARGEAVNPGWSKEPIGTVLILSKDGTVVDVKPWRDSTNKKPRQEFVPKWFGRSGTGSTPYFLWDNTAYALGVSAKDPEKTRRDHASFKSMHIRALAGVEDEAGLALRRFLEAWDPVFFCLPLFSEDLLKWNVAFQLDGDGLLLHDRPFVAALVDILRSNVDQGQRGESTSEAMCLVRGEILPISRLHRKIKGVDGTASAEVPLVSFEGDAFRSYGKEQGDNAPTSTIAVFRYSAALNALLERGISRNRLKIGDATIAFWADASEQAACTAEELFHAFFEPAPTTVSDDDLEADKQEAAKLRDQLEKVAEGRPEQADPRLRPGVRFHVLGLAPNAARLSVRYWLDDDFSRFARRLAEHAADMRIEPRPHRWGQKPPSVARLLVKTTALQEKFDNIPPLLAGEVMRAILAGTRYPRTWLAAALIRLRAGDDAGTGWHAAVIRAVLERDRRLKSDDDAAKREGIPVSLDRTRPDDPAYHLGRLFAALETAQRLALGRVNATIRDRYFGAASATPAGVFPLLMRGAQNHVGKLRKERKDGWIEREIGDIVAQLPPALPRSLKLEAQGRFAIGYYHQRQAQFAGRPKLATEIEAGERDDENAEESDV